jgi:uncharacterized membrane protein
MIFPQSFSHLIQFAYNFYVLSKMCSKWHPRRWRHTCIRRAKLSMTRTHSSYGIFLIVAVIATFSSPIVWGLFSYTLSRTVLTENNRFLCIFSFTVFIVNEYFTTVTKLRICAHHLLLYNNTPSKAIVYAASNITYRPIIQAAVL